MRHARSNGPRSWVREALFAAAVLGAPAAVLAQAVPHALVASPEVYRVIAENEQYRVIEVVWKPGQRDVWHSHAVAGVYNLTDCTMRIYTPDGKSREGSNKAGASRVNAAVPSHWLENIGSSDCRLIMFEPK